MQDAKEIRSGIRDEIIHSGLGYAVFHGRDTGCFEIDGGLEDHKNHLMTEKTPNNDHLYERNDNFCISGLTVTSMRPCPRPPPFLPLALGLVTITPYKERLAWRACLSKVIQLQSLQ